MKIGGSLAWNESMGIMLRPLFIALLVLAVPCEDDDKQDKATGVQVEQEDDNDSDGGPEGEWGQPLRKPDSVEASGWLAYYFEG